NYKIIVSAEINTAEIQKQLNQFSKTAKIKVDSSGVRQAAKDVGFLGVKWADAGKKFLAWKIIGDAFSGIERAITQMVSSVYELDTALTEFNKVTDLSEQQLDKFIDKAYKAGEATARTGTEMIRASTEFAKAGFDENQSLELAKTATMFQNIADTEISAAEASSFIISQIKAFNIEAENSVRIINVVNEVANKFAVGSDDLQSALTKAGSSMGVLGNSYEETVGIITAGTEIMVGQSSKVSRGIRTIGINLAKMATETGVLETAAGKASISLKDENGEMKSTFGIMSDLYPIWQTLNEEQKTMLAQTVAGKNQFEVFVNTLNNFGTAIDATAVAMDSENSAVEENATYMESLKAHISGLRSEFEKLSVKTLSSDFLKSLIDAGTGTLQFIDKIGGLSTVLVALTGIFITLKGASVLGAVVKMFSSLKLTLDGLVVSTKIAKTEQVGLATVLWGTNAAAKTLQLTMGILTAAITIGIAVFSAYKQKQEELRQESLERAKASAEEAKAISVVYGELSNLSKIQNKTTEEEEFFRKIQEDAVELLGGRTTALDGLTKGTHDYIAALILLTETELKEKQVKLKSDTDKAKDAIESDAKYWTGASKAFKTVTQYSEVVGDLLNKYSELRGSDLSGISSYISAPTNSKEIIQYYEDLKTAQQKLKDEATTTGDSNIYLSDTYKNIENAINELTPSMEAYQELLFSQMELDAQLQVSKDRQSTNIRNKDEYDAYIQSIKDATQYSDEYEKVLIDIASKVFPQYSGAIQAAGDSNEETKTEFQKLSDELVNISDKMSILSGAQDEINKTGGITAKTFKSLVENDLIQYLQIVDGEIVGVNDSLQKQAEETRNSAVAQVQATLTTNVLAIAQGTLSDKTDEVKKSSENVLDPLTKAGDKFSEIGAKALSAEFGVSAFNSALKDEGFDITEFSRNQAEAMASQIKIANQEIAAINALYSGAGASSGNKQKEKKSKKSEPDAWKAEFDAFYKDLQYRRDKDIISDEQYHDELAKANQKYFSNKKEYLDDFKKYDIEVYEYLKKREIEIEEEKRKEYSAIKQDLEHNEFLSASGGATGEKSIEYFKQMQKNAHDEAQRLRDKGVSENDDYLQELQKQWWDYQTKITSIQESEEKKREEGRQKALLKSLENEKSKFEATLSIYERYAEGRSDAAQKEIDRLNEEKDSLQKLNGEREDAIHLQELENALAKAKTRQVRIYREGKGFVYEQDSIAVSDAKKNLGEYKRQESLKKEQARIDSEIKLWEEEKKKWSEVVSNYKEQQDLLLAEQISGISLEKLNHDNRLSNLKDFVLEYNRINSELTNVNSDISNVGGGSSSSIDRIKEEMAKNSEKWSSASASEKKELESINQSLGSSIGGKFNPASG
ncbi:MAG: phage tail tape measure protein, partial [Christensenellaceae bacterium]